MLPFQIAVAIDNFPSKSLQARALDSIRKKPQSSPGLSVAAAFRSIASSRLKPTDIPKFNEKMRELFWGGAHDERPRAKAAFN